MLEADLLANAGITRTMVAEFVRVFLQSTALFQRFLLEHGEPLPADQADPAGQQARVAASPRG